MVIARTMDTMRRLLYRGKIKEIILKYNINDDIEDLYWGIYRNFVSDEIEVEINDTSAVFPVTTYPEYRVVNAVQGEEKPVVNELIERVADDDIIWDIGANIGTFSCLLGEGIEDGKIIAFEPYPPNVDKLKRNMDINSVDYEIMPLALSDTNDEADFYALYSEKAGTQQGSIANDYAEVDNAKQTISVTCMTGDQLVSEGEVPIPNVIKIDVEGAAVEVINGMLEILESPKCRLVVVEPHNNREAIESRLSDMGFEMEDVQLGENRKEEPPTVFAHKN